MRLLILLFLAFSTSAYTQTVSDQTRQQVWKEYIEQVRNDSKRQKEHNSKAISYNNKTMKYEAKKAGAPDKNGLPLYIALHGGGGAPPRINDSQWEHMKVYYFSSVKQGIYVAPRGVTDTWNLHFVAESYALYDRLIENMVAFEGVDPNRVYIMGFSAGGDGTYQISTRMADRWAATAMSAGHHNNVSPRNLYNLPMLLQVGDNDKAYKRNLVTVEYGERLQKLQEQEKSGYKYQLNVHFRRGHNFLDNHPKEPMQKVISNPEEWAKNGNAKVKDLNTNSVSWLKNFERNPLPERVIWDTKTKAKREGVRDLRHYWLGVSENTESEIIASYDKKQKSITIEKAVDGMLIFLNSRMMDLSGPVSVKIDNKDFEVKPVSSVENLKKTLNERGDKNYMFEAILKLTKKDSSWSIESL